MSSQKFAGYMRQAAILVLVFLSVGVCTAASSAESKVVRIGYQPWPGVTIKTQVVSDVLKAIGYETEKKQLQTAIILQSLAKGSLDINMGIWYPMFHNKYDPFIEKHEVDEIAVNLPDMTYGYAVPEYVHKGGVNSFADLQKYAEKFDSTFAGIEAGAAGNLYLKKAIKADEFGLGDWTVKPSSTAAEMAQVERAVKKKQWIIFVAWKPHWMNAKWDLYYVKAPQGNDLRPQHGVVYTIATHGFADKNPNVARFFRQFRVDAAIQSQWTLDMNDKGLSPEQIAKAWIGENLDIVAGWLVGVKTYDGKETAMDALRQVYGKTDK